MGTATINMPALGVPEGEKQAGQRVDFKPTKFDLAIETKGYLLLWERAMVCPCAPVADQTEQPDPNCDVCKGRGWTYFGPSEAQDLSEYELTDLQEKMREDSGGSIIRGVTHTIGSNPDPVNILSNWVEGSAMLTVRNENRLGYYDRITLLDAEIVFSEHIKADGGTVLPTRYPVVGVNQLRSVSQVYEQETDFDLNLGEISWRSGYEPDEDTHLALHYICHPTYLVITHPHAARVTSQLFKTPTPKAPTGGPRQLPVQAIIRYEFLPEPS